MKAQELEVGGLYGWPHMKMGIYLYPDHWAGFYVFYNIESNRRQVIRYTSIEEDRLFKKL